MNDVIITKEHKQKALLLQKRILRQKIKEANLIKSGIDLHVLRICRRLDARAQANKIKYIKSYNEAYGRANNT